MNKNINIVFQMYRKDVSEFINKVINLYLENEIKHLQSNIHYLLIDNDNVNPYIKGEKEPNLDPLDKVSYRVIFNKTLDKNYINSCIENLKGNTLNYQVQ